VLFIIIIIEELELLLLANERARIPPKERITAR
jgi:hypothetical protein